MLIHPEQPIVILSARTCAWLERYAGLTALRVKVRGTDPAISRELEDLRAAAMSWRASATGSEVAPEPEAAPPLQWLSSSHAADLLGITDRAIRLACRSGRLDAQQVAGHWRISREAVEQYRAARAA